MRIVIKIFTVGKTKIRLQNIECASRPKFELKLFEYDGKILLGQMFEEIARKDKVDGIVSYKA